MTDPINLSPSEIVNFAFRAGITASLTEILHKTVPAWPHQGQPVLVLADTEFGTIDFFKAIHQRQWRAVVGVRDSRTLEDGLSLKQLYRQGKRGQHVRLKGIPFPLTVFWFWLKQQGGKRDLRLVASTHPYSGAYLVRLGRKRSAIEGFSKPSNIALVGIVLDNRPKLGCIAGWFWPSLPISSPIRLTKPQPVSNSTGGPFVS